MAEKHSFAFYTDTYLPAVDGVVTSIINSAKELRRRGNKVYIFTSGNQKHIVPQELREDVFFMRGMRFRKYPQYSLAIFPFASALRIKDLNIELIHAHTPFFMGISGLTIAKVNRIPLVGSFHTLFTDKRVIDEYTTMNPVLRNLAYKKAWSYVRFFYNRCGRTIAPSEAIKRVLNSNQIMNVDVVPNGVDIKRFRGVDGSAIREKYAPNGEKLVLYLGRLSTEKSIDVMIKAAKRLAKNKKIRFLIAGTGPAYERYRRMVANNMLSDKVFFSGFVDSNDLPKFYAAADVFCIPSTFETQGIVSLEAMASGKPVIGADYLALSDIIKDGYNGEKFKPGSSIDCAFKIEKVINNIDAYRGMLETAKRFSVEKCTDGLLKTYEKAIGNI
ncbi:MAG: glycosyltransferase [Candidatus Micrarchaeaceae archaeon]